MTDPRPVTYIATVWFSDQEGVIETRHVIRLQAVSAEDFKTQIRQSWPFKVVSFGPVSLSKVQA